MSAKDVSLSKKNTCETNPFASATLHCPTAALALVVSRSAPFLPMFVASSDRFDGSLHPHGIDDLPLLYSKIHT